MGVRQDVGGNIMTNKEENIRIKDRPNKVRAKLIIDVEGEFYDDESTAETLRYCVEQDLEDAGFNVIDSEVFENNELLSPDERADVLNAINDMLEEKGFDLEVCGYEDNNGVFFDVMLMER